MGTRRLGFALLAALVISLGISSVFYVRITRTQASTRPNTKRVVAAAVALQPGAPITAENLTEINWPVNVPLEGLIEKKQDVAGHVLMYAVAANEPVLQRDLAASASLGLAAKIPDGMRATAVKTNEVTNIAGFILPGSHVDVLVTLRTENNTAASTETRTVLQNVQVLSTGTKMDPDPNGKPENVNVVTLLVSPEQSEKLALAQNQGTIHFVLRNGGDSANTDVPPVDMAGLAGIVKKPAQPEMKHLKQIAAAVKLPDVYTVETLVNGKTTISKFPVKPE
ncbi:MAG: Flp pilus assembly protein CpaB [Acidobacteria bacterium]|nr:MAG: Flp pilus assembly protein CpaB [Acidobacteriota bacterium]